MKKFLLSNRASLITLLALILLPFIVGLMDGESPMAVLANESGNEKFAQGLALSFDLIFGITGMLSFGHSMFFGVGAYLTGISLKTLGLSLPATLGLVFIAAIVQAILFGLVLPRVKGITFALVTLGMGSVFHIVVMSSELGPYTGADVGL